MPSDLRFTNLRTGDKGDEVKALQDILNRTGALLLLDGVFGPGTVGAINRCQTLANQQVTGIADGPLVNWLDNQPEPSPKLSCEAVTFIVRQEVSSRTDYDRYATHPNDPGNPSGVTIGIGYDLRFQINTFEIDWEGEVTQQIITRLSATLGQIASPSMIAGLSDITIAFEAAWRVFIKSSLPGYYEKTAKTFPNFESLPDLCKAALISLVYNRGTSLTGPKRVEMRTIKNLIVAGSLQAVPEQFEKMEQLFTSPGLKARRQREANLWQQGLGQSP